MTYARLLLPVFLLLLGLSVQPAALGAPAAAPLPETLKPEGASRRDYSWQQRHRDVAALNAAEKPEYAFLGDSITHHWGGSPTLGCHNWSKESWEKLFEGHRVVNMGFGADTIDNAYYRIAHDELGGASPRVILVLLGTNNLGGRRHDTPRACADNMKALLALLRQKAPSSKILLLGILPRREPGMAEPVAETNRLYRKLADNKTIFFLDLTRVLALPAPSGKPPLADPALMLDVVHPNAAGYEALVPALQKALRKIDSRF